MAEVFKARVTGAAGFAREVVLKRLLSSNNADPEFVSMFEDEARILGVLHHPNVVQALDFGKADDQLYLVLEYVEGPSLGRVLRSRCAVPPAVVAYLGREIARALDYVHNVDDVDGTPLGLIHRDVTPTNIIVTPSGTVKLLDFGVAKFAKAMHATGAGTVKGKSGYVAPEQLREGAIDGRVDLFALGIVLHELLVGERLFQGENDLGTLRKVLDMKIPAPSTKLAGVPPALDRIVMRALARDPSKRYASAAEMARDLDEVVVAARLRIEDVAAFVGDVELAAAVAPEHPVATSAGLPKMEATRRDLLLPVRRWVDALPSGRRSTLVAGLTLALATAGALGWGATSHGSGERRSAGRLTPARAAPEHRVPVNAPLGPSRTLAETTAWDR